MSSLTTGTPKRNDVLFTTDIDATDNLPTLKALIECLRDRVVVAEDILAACQEREGELIGSAETEEERQRWAAGGNVQ